MSFAQPTTGARRGANVDKLILYLAECGISLSKQTIYNYVQQGNIPYRRFSGRRKGAIYFDLDKIDEWIDQDNSEQEQIDKALELDEWKAINQM